MGDWRTLHLFDHNHFRTIVAPAILKDPSSLFEGLSPRLQKWLTGFGKPTAYVRDEVLRLLERMEPDLMVHREFMELSKPHRGEAGEVRSPISQWQQADAFRNTHAYGIEAFQELLKDRIFATCAIPYPHFLLGKRRWERSLEGEPGSLAEELLDKVTSPEAGSVLDLVDGGIMNWLSAEEVECLVLDQHQIRATEEAPEHYRQELIQFLSFSAEAGLGWIALRNPMESTWSASSEAVMEQVALAARDRFQGCTFVLCQPE